MLRVLSAAVAVAAAAVVTVPGAAHASPAGAPHVSVRLWRHVVHEPGTLGLTFTDTRDVKDVYAVATSASGNDVAVSAMVRQRGHVFTLYLRFPRGQKTGTWYLAGVWATPAGGKSDPYAPPVTWAVLGGVGVGSPPVAAAVARGVPGDPGSA